MSAELVDFCGRGRPDSALRKKHSDNFPNVSKPAQTIDIAGMNSRHDMAYIHSIEKSIIKTPLLYILVFCISIY